MRKFDLTLKEAQNIYRLHELQAMLYEEQISKPDLDEDIAFTWIKDFERRPYHYADHYPEYYPEPDDVNSIEIEREIQREISEDQSLLISEWAHGKSKFINSLRTTVDFLNEASRIQIKPRKFEIDLLEKENQYEAATSINSISVHEALYKSSNVIFQVYESEEMDKKFIKSRLHIPRTDKNLISLTNKEYDDSSQKAHNKYFLLTNWDYVNWGVPESILNLNILNKSERVPRESFKWYTLRNNKLHVFCPSEFIEYLVSKKLEDFSNKIFSFKHKVTKDAFILTGVCVECKSVGYLRAADYHVEAHYSYSFEELSFKFTEGRSYSLR